MGIRQRHGVGQVDWKLEVMHRTVVMTVVHTVWSVRRASVKCLRLCQSVNTCSQVRGCQNLFAGGPSTWPGPQYGFTTSDPI